MQNPRYFQLVFWMVVHTDLPLPWVGQGPELSKDPGEVCLRADVAIILDDTEGNFKTEKQAGWSRGETEARV